MTERKASKRIVKTSANIPKNDDKLEIKMNHKRIINKKKNEIKEKLAIASPLQSPRSKSSSAFQSPVSASRSILQSPKVLSALQSPAGQRLLNFNTPSKSSPLLSKLQPAAPVVSKEQMSKLFEEWIKIAADNKINANNTWNLALIDYFSELSLLKDGDSINFQKASCTLDGCVKIYTSRVDSVASEAGKLLNGLADNEMNKKAAQELDDDEDDDEVETEKPSHKRRVNKGSTIEKNPQALNLKKFDMEFSVDPLFKKTCADFDEGGCRGLLLNNLMMDPSGKIIFDSSDAVFEEVSKNEFEYKDYDSKTLKEKFFNFDLDDLEICPSLSKYDFNSSSSVVIPEFQEIMNKISNHENQNVEEDLEDLVNFTDENDYYDNFGDAGEDMDHVDTNDVPNADQEQSRLVQAFESITISGDENIYHHFDSQLSQNWAGPQHWKLRPFFKRADAKKSLSQAKKDKKQTTIDFVNHPIVDVAALFNSKTTTSSSTILSKAQIQERSTNSHLLPTDVHFSSKEILAFFTKPMWNFKKTQVLTQLNEKFWSEEENHGQGLFNEIQITDDIGLIANEEQNDDDDIGNDDGGGFDVFDDAEEFTQPENPFEVVHNEISCDFGSSLVAEPKLTKTLKMNYAKTAKKVDVKRLKDNIWKEFKEKEKTDPIPFTEIVHGLDKVYPQEKLKDISVPFCFICLLHLANENNLKIQGSDDLNDLFIVQD